MNIFTAVKYWCILHGRVFVMYYAMFTIVHEFRFQFTSVQNEGIFKYILSVELAYIRFIKCTYCNLVKVHVY